MIAEQWLKIAREAHRDFSLIMIEYRTYERGHGTSLHSTHTRGLCAGLSSELM